MMRLKRAVLTAVVAALAITLARSAEANDESKFVRATDEWLELAKRVTRYDCEQMKRIHEAVCMRADPEPSEFHGRSDAQSAVGAAQRVVQSNVQNALGKYEQLKRLGSALRSKGKRSVVDKQYSRTAPYIRRIREINRNGAVRGWNHPLVQFAVNYGKQQHKRMENESRYQCDAKDQYFGGKRPDCVSARLCKIFEFKPRNSTAISKGKNQLTTYKPLVERYYAEHIVKHTTPPSNYGGRTAVIKMLKNTSCWNRSSKRLSFKKEVATYPPCKFDYRCN